MKQELQTSKAEITNVQSVLQSKEKVSVSVPVDMYSYTRYPVHQNLKILCVW